VFEAAQGYVPAFYDNGFKIEEMLGFGRAPFRIVDPGYAIKMFPSQFGTHFGITAGLELHPQIPDATAIRRVLLTAPVMTYVNRPRPKKGLEGKFSLQYTAASALLDGKVGIRTFTDERLAKAGYLRAVVIGCAQILALLAGISRDGVTMVAGMARGLSREDAARFAFLLATPVILAAGVLKYNDLIVKGRGIYGPILVGSILSGLGAYVSVRFLVKYFQTRTLTPFAIYCVLAGLGSIIYLSVK